MTFGVRLLLIYPLTMLHYFGKCCWWQSEYSQVSFINNVLQYVCEFTCNKGHQIARSHFCSLIVPSVSNAIYFSIKMWSTCSFTVGNYLFAAYGSRCMTIQAAMSFLPLFTWLDLNGYWLSWSVKPDDVYDRSLMLCDSS